MNKPNVIESDIHAIEDMKTVLLDFWEHGKQSQWGDFRLPELRSVLGESDFRDFLDNTFDVLDERKAELELLQRGIEHSDDDDWFHHLRPFQKVLVNECGFWKPAFFSNYGCDSTFGPGYSNAAICIGMGTLFPKELIKPYNSNRALYMKDDDEIFRILSKKYPHYG